MGVDAGNASLLDEVPGFGYYRCIRAPEGLLKKLTFNYMKFFKSLGTEFGKITWPTWSMAFGHAMLVIVIALLVGYYLGLLDAVFAGVLKLIIN